MQQEYYKYLLSGLLLFGFIFSKGYSFPADDGMQDDVGDYEDNDPAGGHAFSSSPSDKSTISNLRSTIAPMFEKIEYSKHSKPGDDTFLECPVKNLQDNNVIIWYREKTIIVQGKQILVNRYGYDPTNHTLKIPKAKVEDSGNYNCSVLPQGTNLHVKLTVSELPPNQAEAQSSSSLSPTPNGASLPSSMIFSEMNLIILVTFNVLIKFMSSM